MRAAAVFWLFCFFVCVYFFRVGWNIGLVLFFMFNLQITHIRKWKHMLWNQTLYLDKKKHWALGEKSCIIKGFSTGSITGERVNGGNLGLWLLLTFSKRSFHPQHPSLSPHRNDGLPAEEMRYYLLITVLPQWSMSTGDSHEERFAETDRQRKREVDNKRILIC